ncbi:peptidyl-prolyl cis-trans isomerase FKBP4-like [Aphidius gifuensis]|uniref:peptidyl-prolyl cis-trans isomerase FKBP4-like n=1 Tax=Aphidius gifuensis TaxID=684658 RepID=UPI001CDC7077|nr:peptidyl-prolyl cis-trans isomerase FKBP4-like [Aphidius gifuensis]
MKTNYCSSDKSVEKTVIKHGKISNKPQDGSICSLLIEDVQTIPQDIDLQQYHSEILTGNSTVQLTIDESSSQLDRQIERAIKWMGDNEVALVKIVLPALSDQEECPKNNQLKFKITLIDHKPVKPIWDWTPQEKFDKALERKETGVELVNKSRTKDAFYKFSKAVKIIISMEPIKDLNLDDNLNNKINDLRVSLYNNMAMCQLKYNNYDHTIELCNKVLMRDKNNVKALYRRGCAYGAITNVEKALDDFKYAHHIEPQNNAVKSQLLIYQEKWKKAEKETKDIIRKMFT